MIAKMFHSVLNYSSSEISMQDTLRVCLILDTNKPPDLIENCLSSNPLHYPLIIRAKHVRSKATRYKPVVYLSDGHLRIGSESSESLGLSMNCLRKGHIAKKC